MMTVGTFLGILSLCGTLFALGYGVGYNQGRYHGENNNKK